MKVLLLVCWGSESMNAQEEPAPGTPKPAGSSAAEPSVEGKPAGLCALAGVAQHLAGVAIPVRHTGARPSRRGVAPFGSD